jgi:hypothetical protein
MPIVRGVGENSVYKPDEDDLAKARMGVAVARGYEDIIYFFETFLGVEPHDGQKVWLQAISDDLKTGRKTKIWTIVSANRWGKTLAVAGLHIWYNFYKVGVGRGNDKAWTKAAYMTANLAPHSDATKPVFEAIIAILTSAFPIPLGDGSIKSNNCIIGYFLDQKHIRTTVPLLISYSNNCSTIFRSTGEDKGDSIQGKNFGFISFDEGGRDNHLEYAVNSNIIPRLADLNGSLAIVSTPDMKSNSILYHYDIFQKGLQGEYGYYSQEGSIEQNKFLLRNNPDYVKNEKRRLKGDPILDQVLYGKFVFAGDNIFPTPDIMDARDDTLTEGESPKAKHTYVIGIDTAMGEDEMVFTVLDTTSKPFRVVRQLSAKGNSKSPQIHMDDFIGLFRNYNHEQNACKVIIETYNGESARFFLDLPYDVQVSTTCFGAWQPQGRKVIGRNSKNVKKAELILALRKLLANKEIVIPNEPNLIKQLSIYREDDSRLPTDRVISLALTCWLATDGAPISNNEVVDVDW